MGHRYKRTGEPYKGLAVLNAALGWANNSISVQVSKMQEFP